MRLLSLNPLLYLEEYKILPEDIYLWKQDEELHPAASGRNTGKIPWGPEGRYKKAGFFPFSIRGYVCGKPLLHRKESFAYF